MLSSLVASQSQYATGARPLRLAASGYSYPKRIRLAHPALARRDGSSHPPSQQAPITWERYDELSRDFIELRGDLFTGGLVCKQFVKLKHYGRRTNEWRAFFFDGTLLDFSGNSLQFAFCPAPPTERYACGNGQFVVKTRRRGESSAPLPCGRFLRDYFGMIVPYLLLPVYYWNIVSVFRGLQWAEGITEIQLKR